MRRIKVLSTCLISCFRICFNYSCLITVIIDCINKYSMWGSMCFYLNINLVPQFVHIFNVFLEIMLRFVSSLTPRPTCRSADGATQHLSILYVYLSRSLFEVSLSCCFSSFTHSPIIHSTFNAVVSVKCSCFMFFRAQCK